MPILKSRKNFNSFLTEDALKINVKHVGFLKSDFRNESK